ncbi:MAG TPA: hypothetical protein VGD67_12095 [Pseudonocardiaceae bacterium]
MAYLLAGPDVAADDVNQLLYTALAALADAATVAPTGSTSSTSYVSSLTTSGATPAVTLTSRGSYAWVSIGVTCASSDASLRGHYTSVAISGDTTTAANDAWAVRISATNAGIGLGGFRTIRMPITPGTNTYTVQHRMNAALGGTGTFTAVDLTVFAP